MKLRQEIRLQHPDGRKVCIKEYYDRWGTLVVHEDNQTKQYNNSNYKIGRIIHKFEDKGFERTK
jgi:hypothetical protein